MGTLNVQSKEVSMQIKEAIIRLKTNETNHRDQEFLLKTKECTGERSNTKRPWRLQSSSKVYDCEILSLVKEKRFHDKSKPLEKVGASLSTSTINPRDTYMYVNTESLSQDSNHW